VTIDWNAKLKATALHFALSLLLAFLAAGLVYFVWYPSPYRDLLWGQGIYVWLIAVDAILGPLLTFVVFNSRKRMLERFIDFSLIGSIQIGALAYGIWALSEARPLYVVFEYDKFRVVPDYFVPTHARQQAPDHLKALPWGRPGLISLRRLPEDEADIAVWTKNLDFGGPPLAAQPRLWQDYALAAEQVTLNSIAFDELLRRYPSRSEDLGVILRRSGLASDQLVGVPIYSEKGEGILILSKKSQAVMDLLVLQREVGGW
jgi:hypothetical protein